MPIAELRDVVKEFPDAEGGAPRRILDRLSLAIDEGGTLAVVGPSGCGKSTLLNLIGLLDEPTSGSVHLAGQPVDRLPENERARLRATTLGFVFQLHHLLPQCTVLENVLIPSLALSLTSAQSHESRERARHLLERVGLTAHQHDRPATLSGGERQRAAVVRALINQPRLVLADEPTGSLDAERGRELIDLLLELQRETRSALVVVTHDESLASRLGSILRLGGEPKIRPTG